MAQTVRFRIRRDTAANWTSINPTLELGEPGLETDTRKVKYGDGSTAWTSLSYAAGIGAVTTWTPAITFGGAATGVTYGASNTAKVYRDGPFVFVQGYLQLTNKGSSTGSAALILPVAPSVVGAGSAGLGIYGGMSGVTAPLFLDLGNTTTAVIYITPATALTDANFTNSSAIQFGFAYLAAS